MKQKPVIGASGYKPPVTQDTYTNESKLDPISFKEAPQPLKKKTSEIFKEQAVSYGSDLMKNTVLPILANAVYDIGIKALKAGIQKLTGASVTTTSADTAKKYNMASQQSAVPWTPISQSRVQQPLQQTAQYQQMVFATYNDAQEVLDAMSQYIVSYGGCRVSDYNACVGLPSSNWVDSRNGWFNLSTASIQATAQGYVLVLPQPGPIVG